MDKTRTLTVFLRLGSSRLTAGGGFRIDRSVKRFALAAVLTLSCASQRGEQSSDAASAARSARACQSVTQCEAALSEVREQRQQCWNRYGDCDSLERAFDAAHARLLAAKDRAYLKAMSPGVRAEKLQACYRAVATKEMCAPLLSHLLVAAENNQERRRLLTLSESLSGTKAR